MARQLETDARVLGPYYVGRSQRGWRVVVVDEKGRRTQRHYETQEEAKQIVWATRKRLSQFAEKTVDEALDAYELYMRRAKGNKVHSAATTVARLRPFFADLELPLSALQRPGRCEGYYKALRERPTKYGRPPAADTHRNTLVEARSFLKWCVKQKWLSSNPLDEVEGEGRRRHGKPQLYVDEARKWSAKALELAAAGEEGAVAALMTLFLNMRASEIMGCVARNVDDGGRLLWIPSSKTPAGRRTLEVPDILRPFLVRLASGKKPEERIFRCESRSYPRGWVRKICRLAGVPLVCAHGMRGTHSSLAHQMGMTSHVVALAMGHESERTTLESYTDPSAVATGQQRRLLQVLEGARR
jgi:integrase